MITWRFKTTESSGRKLYAITMQDETPKHVKNVGKGRTREERWEKCTQPHLLVAHKENTLEFLAFSERAARHIVCDDRGISRHTFVREAAQRQLQGVSNVTTKYSEVSMLLPQRVVVRPGTSHPSDGLPHTHKTTRPRQLGMGSR